MFIDLRSISGAASTPAAGATVAQDTFSRNVTGGWGNAPTGGAWSTSSNANSAVTGTTATLTHGAGALRRAMLNQVSIDDVDLTVDFASNKDTTVGHIVAGLVARQVSAADYYQARVRILPGGTLGLQLTRGSSSIVVANATVAGLTYAAGDTLTLRFQVEGTSPTTLRAKVWPAGSPEPATWQLVATDTTAALQTEGAIGLESYISASATNAPVVVTYDNYNAVRLP